MSTFLPAADAARELGISPSTLRRWIAGGCPVVRRGRRGRGGAALVDPDAVAAWRSAASGDAVLLEVASALPQVLADAMAEAHRLIEGPVKTPAAAALAGAWYVAAAAVLDHLRQRCPGVPELVAPLPEPVERLRKIAGK